MDNSTQAAPKRVFEISWRCRHTWSKAMKNTLACLIGCSIGDFGTIAVFQINNISWPTGLIMTLAIVNGLLSSIALETFFLVKEMSLKAAFQTAVGMSMFSMIAMEVAMNAVDWRLTGGAKLTLWVVPLMLITGFIAPLPYNYWRLKALGKSCH